MLRQTIDAIRVALSSGTVVPDLAPSRMFPYYILGTAHRGFLSWASVRIVENSIGEPRPFITFLQI